VDRIVFDEGCGQSLRPTIVYCDNLKDLKINVNYHTHKYASMKYLCAFFFLITIHGTAFAQNGGIEQMKVQQVVRDLFEGFSAHDLEKMQQCLTPDAIILEHDVIFTMDSIAALVQRKTPPDFKRVNTLTFFQTELGKDMAFVSYYNEANITSNGNQWYIKWLESAVLIKDNKRWRIKMLHSTRMERRKA
jgi:ketosteroid isomerase-like protein